jgi:CheY-like chemotaxis protein
MALNKKIALRFNQSGIDLFVNVDERRVRQILTNLLTNAVKFTPKGGTVTLEVETSDDERWVHFVISDTGIGIPEEKLSSIFHPFYQIDNGLSRSEEGTGLGLSLVQKLTKLHGGHIQVESELNRGSAFTVTLPLCSNQFPGIVDDLPCKEVPLTSETDGSDAGKVDRRPLRVFIVDDNKKMLETLREFLEFNGHNVMTAMSGLKGLEMLAAMEREDCLDLIFMDLQMPGLSGIDTIKQIREVMNWRNIPIIALTALAMESDRASALQSWASDYLSKPVTLSRLSEVIDRYAPPLA